MTPEHSNISLHFPLLILESIAKKVILLPNVLIIILQEFPEVDKQTCVGMLKIDFKNYFENNFSSTAKINATVFPLQWASSHTEKFTLRPRFVRVMAQEEHMVLFRAFILAPERTWILVNMNTMIMNPLKSQTTARFVWNSSLLLKALCPTMMISDLLRQAGIVKLYIFLNDIANNSSTD